MERAAGRGEERGTSGEAGVVSVLHMLLEQAGHALRCDAPCAAPQHLAGELPCPAPAQLARRPAGPVGCTRPSWAGLKGWPAA